MALGAFLLYSPQADAADVSLLNVSYDPTRELYQEYNAVFAKYWKARTGDDVAVQQSHGGGGKQTRAVIDGLEADVVTLALAYDVDQLHQKRRLIPQNWQSLLPHNSSPYTSTMVFVVRKGNPKGIKDWDDLVKDGVANVQPNPKSSGGARWNYLSAWIFAQKKFGNDEAKIKDFVGKFYKNAVVLDTGARGSTTTFVERGIGDVLVTWENEAFLVLREFGADKYEIIVPSVSMLAEPPVAVVEKVAKKNGTAEVAKAYLEYLYGKEGQEIAAKNHYRPRDAEIAAKYADRFPKLELITVDEAFGGWNKAQATHFNDGGVFDQIFVAK
ncbi:MAG TPA: sulfate ABC transporter substrate-binding protein [Methylococcaceae bacterium]|nr:sulfate ABC transporter substrate-binding protein [Methylococcaceae bacterium]